MRTNIFQTVLLLTFSFFSVLTATGQSASYLFGSMQARQIGPAVMSGRITSLAVVNNKPEVIFVGTAGGGIWKSISGGASFYPVFDDHTQAIGCITIDQKRPDTIWAGTGETWVRNSVGTGTGIYRSTNGGIAWECKGLTFSERIGNILVHPDEPDLVYAGVLGNLWNDNENRGVYRTSDGGNAWQRILYLNENTGCADLDMDPEDPNTLYACMWSFRRLPWFFDSGYKGSSGLYRSTDGGKTWNTIHNGLPADTLGRMSLAIAASNPNVLYLSVEVKDKKKKGLYKSTDKGNTWKMVCNDFNTWVRPFYFSEMTVDPSDENNVYKCGYNLIISEDGGFSFREIPSYVHSDIHAVWVDPRNPKHVIIGTDGGVYESVDRAYTFKMFMNLPVSQFYHVSVDDERPYNVYGGLQDNGSWYGPSQKPGGTGNYDWKMSYGGDGFYSFRHPTRKNIIYSEYQGGNIVRYDTETSRAKDIMPYATQDVSKLRFNWNTPVHISPSNPDRLYIGAQHIYVSDDMGDSWKRISPDLTTHDPLKLNQKKSGGLSVDNSTAENHCTVYAIAESPVDEKVIWAGTDDGNLQLTTDSGQNWTNVAGNITGLPANTWISYIEPGHHDRSTTLVTCDGHRTGDMNPYVFVTHDYGKTWTNLATSDIQGYAYVIREDLMNPDLLFLGTESGLYISLNGGKSWTRFKNNLPPVAIHDIVIHPRDNSLVMASHGRGIIIIDDISPLRQLTPEILAKSIHFFDVKPTIIREPGSRVGWFGGGGEFTAPNPSSSAQIIYYMAKRHTFGKMYFEVFDSTGLKIKELPAGKSAGINTVSFPVNLSPPKSAPTNNTDALMGSLYGPCIAAGTYTVKLIQGKEEYVTRIKLVYDTASPYTPEDREEQRNLTLRLFNLSEQLAFIYTNLDGIVKQCDNIIRQSPKSAKKITPFQKEVDFYKESLVAMGGDGYVDQDERLRERISALYGKVSSYPGRPSQSQTDQTALLESEMNKVKSIYNNFTVNKLATINKGLKKSGVSEITLKEQEH